MNRLGMAIDSRIAATTPSCRLSRLEPPVLATPQLPALVQRQRGAFRRPHSRLARAAVSSHHRRARVRVGANRPPRTARPLPHVGGWSSATSAWVATWTAAVTPRRLSLPFYAIAGLVPNGGCTVGGRFLRRSRQDYVRPAWAATSPRSHRDLVHRRAGAATRAEPRRDPFCRPRAGRTARRSDEGGRKPFLLTSTGVAYIPVASGGRVFRRSAGQGPETRAAKTAPTTAPQNASDRSSLLPRCSLPPRSWAGLRRLGRTARVGAPRAGGERLFEGVELLDFAGRARSSRARPVGAVAAARIRVYRWDFLPPR